VKGNMKVKRCASPNLEKGEHMAISNCVDIYKEVGKYDNKEMGSSKS
jgi:hypothetical protein